MTFRLAPNQRLWRVKTYFGLNIRSVCSRHPSTFCPNKTYLQAVADATNEIVSKFESRLSEALSEGNIRAASQLWRRLLDTPGVQFLVREQRLWAGAKQAVQRYLGEYMSKESKLMAERAVKATTEFAIHFA